MRMLTDLLTRTANSWRFVKVIILAATARFVATSPAVMTAMAINRGRFWGLLLEPVRPVRPRPLPRPWQRWR
jgi:hypothetical protein